MESTAGPQKITGFERFGSLQGKELYVKAEAMTRSTDDSLVDHLTGLVKRMDKLEASQEAEDQLVDWESNLFGLAIGQGQPTIEVSGCDTAEVSVSIPFSRYILRCEPPWVCKGGCIC